MKFLKASWVGFFLLAATSGFASSDGSRIQVQLQQTGVVQAGTVSLSFQLMDTQQNQIVADSDLAVLHEKKLHFFIFDASLTEFRHVHPEFDGKLWQVKADIPVDGNYWVWAQGELAADQSEFTASGKLTVQGGSQSHPLPPVLGEVKRASDGISSVTLSYGKLYAGQMAMIDLKFSRTDGSSPALGLFLGEKAHVIATPSKGDSLTHVHPMDHGVPNQLMLHTEFPAAGEYRLWVQFMDGEQLRTVPLSVVVSP